MAQPGKPKGAKIPAPKPRSAKTASGRCLCGAVVLEVEVPVFWAWHDHTPATRRAHGAAYATYVGCWRSKVRVTKGEGDITRFEDQETGSARSFCRRCGTPLLYERKRDTKFINLPRALLSERTGREAKYHIGHEQLQDWAYLGAPVGPLKGYPGVTVERTRKKRERAPALFDPDF